MECSSVVTPALTTGYTEIFDRQNLQWYVQVGVQWLRSYTGSDYGKDNRDTVMVRPSLLEMGIYGLLDDYLRMGSASSDDNGDRQEHTTINSAYQKPRYIL